MMLTKTSKTSHLRFLQPHMDLYRVADLVELCFADNMDEDGRIYIRQMRRIANEARYLRVTSVRLEGFVWEETGKIVGNLTLIPYIKDRSSVYLIANVAVHPDYRRRGIAREMTLAAVDYAYEHGAAACWLQVRDDNPGAIRLYESTGFIERARRTSWQWKPHMGMPPVESSEITISHRHSSDWVRQLDWLLRLYPSEVRWNLPFDPYRLNPNLWNQLLGFLRNDRMMHWAASKDGDLIGIVTREPTRSFADSLWVAAHPAHEGTAIRALLPYARRKSNPARALLVNYPAGRAVEAFYHAGFQPHLTLIWMESRFNT